MFDTLIKYLSHFFTPERFQQMISVSNNRTEYILPVLEDMVQPQNTNAIVRSCECLGINRVSLIEGERKFSVYKDVDKGSSKWVEIDRYNNVELCINSLKSNGYRVIGTLPHQDGTLLNNFDIAYKKTAFVFGSEHTGLTNQAINLCDGFVSIPMCGFTESFNVSVSVAITCYTMIYKLKLQGIDYLLPLEVRRKILLDWIKKCLKTPDLILQRFNNQYNTNY